jgi:hypothetical protein
MFSFHISISFKDKKLLGHGTKPRIKAKNDCALYLVGILIFVFG